MFTARQRLVRLHELQDCEDAILDPSGCANDDSGSIAPQQLPHRCGWSVVMTSANKRSNSS
jgi:hypothetical protein